MAEQIRHHTFKCQGRKRFPEEWFNGMIWELTAQDLNCDDSQLEGKKATMMTAAYRRGKRLRFEHDAESYAKPVVIIQFYDPEPRPEPKPRARVARKKARKKAARKK